MAIIFVLFDDGIASMTAEAMNKQKGGERGGAFLIFGELLRIWKPLRAFLKASVICTWEFVDGVWGKRPVVCFVCGLVKTCRRPLDEKTSSRHSTLTPESACLHKEESVKGSEERNQSKPSSLDNTTFFSSGSIASWNKQWWTKRTKLDNHNSTMNSFIPTKMTPTPPLLLQSNKTSTQQQTNQTSK